MGMLSRSALALFIFSTVILWSGEFEGDWIIAVMSVISATLFIILGWHEDNA